MAPLLQARADGNCNCLSDGAIAGIVIGTIAGTLLILWIINASRQSFWQSNQSRPVSSYERERRPRSHRSSRSRRESRTIYVDEVGNRVRAPSRVVYKE